MRIGTYFGDTNPEVGGGFTFQDEVLKALVKQAANALQHEFFIIGSSSSLKAYIDSLQPSQNVSFLLSTKPNVLQRISEWMKRGLLTLSNVLKILGPLERLAKDNKLDLVWFIGGGTFETLDTPYIATVWDLQHRLQPWFPEVSVNGEWGSRESRHRYFLSRASFVIVGTEVGRDEVELFYQIPKFRIHKLPHPTPSFALDKRITAEVDVYDKYKIPKHYILYPAQFWAHKNHINLLHAVKIIRDKYGLELALVLVGSDQGNAKYVSQVAEELGLLNQLHMLGFVPQEDLYGLYKNASMLAYVSLCGPENLPPLEAFAVGCPVLASEVSGSKEQLGDSVLFCDPSNSQDIADKIYQLYTDDNLKEQLITKGHFRASSWTPDDFVQGIFKIVDDFSGIRRNWSSYNE